MTSGGDVKKVNTGSSYPLFVCSNGLFPLRVEYKVKKKSEKLENILRTDVYAAG
jgi:hypothetical protein